MATVHRGLFKIKVMDQTRETQEHFLFNPQMDAGNITAQSALNSDYVTALADIILGNIIEQQTVADQMTEEPPTPATDPVAQVELAWLIGYRDTVTDEYDEFRIATPNMDASLRFSFSDIADLSQTAWVAFKAAFEAAALSKDGNPVELIGAILVGN